MKSLVFVLVQIGLLAPAFAQSVMPDIKGTWTGKAPSVVYGSNAHHPGGQGIETPRIVREIEFTFVVTGQEGRNVWGHNFSANAKTNEPFGWSFTSNGRNGIGADTDGYYQITLESADQMELCYAHNRLSPSGSIVTTCGIYKRVK